ncbi:MAG: M15 family metallopeptidase [Gaiellaceae bacterium]
MRVLVAAVLVVVAATSAAAAGTRTIAPLTKAQRAAVIRAREWHRGCPVSLSQVRLLSVRYYGFDHRSHWGTVVVNERVAIGLRNVFARLYAIRFPIHHMQFGDTYGSLNDVPKDGDFTASFECREASASPCTGVTTNKTTGSWSQHAYGEAVDLNPVENPYVGCGMTRDKTALSYLDRARYREGMVNDSVVRAFASIGWGWGGSWTGSTKDYMHFSVNGH